MPKFTDSDDSPQIQNHAVGHFGYSAVSLDSLESSKYTLAQIVADRSGSTDGFQDMMEAALKEAVESLKPIGEEVLLRVLVIDNDCHEIHGFVPLADIDTSRYDGCLKAQGATAFYDGLISAGQAARDLGAQLIKDRFLANGIIIAITDGVNNAGRFNRPVQDIGQVKKAFTERIGNADSKHDLESLTTVLIGVNVEGSDPRYLWPFEQDGKQVGSFLQALQFVHDEGGFSADLIPMKDAKRETITKIGRFISASISTTSQSVGKGNPSQQLTI